MTGAEDEADEAAIRAVVDVFLGAFASEPGQGQRFDDLRTVVLPSAVITRITNDGPVSDDLDSFVAPRRELLASGALVGFREWAGEGSVTVAGDIAHWWGRYAKAWKVEGVQVEGGGTKSIQFVRATGGWRISAVAWHDDPTDDPTDEPDRSGA